MGCASSAALPFLSNKENEAVSDTPRFNGNVTSDFQVVNNKFKENGVDNMKDVNESFVSDKMKEVVDSTAVQGVIGGVVQTKDGVFNQVKGNIRNFKQLIKSSSMYYINYYLKNQTHNSLTRF